MRVDDDGYEVLQRLAADEDRPMSRILGAAIGLYDEHRLAQAAQATARASGATGRQILSDVAARIAAPDPAPSVCPPHPKEKLQQHAWGTVCGACGVKIR